jgi:ClpP class serine protease
MIEKNFNIESISAALTAAGLNALRTEPLYVDPQGVMKAWLQGRIRLGPRAAADTGDRRPVYRNDMRFMETGPGRFLAVQPVSGIMMSGASAMDEEYYWMFNTDRIHHAVARVAADPAIDGLVLQMNTPGGSVYGLQPAAEALASLSASGVQAVSYIQHDCCSAGMYLAAALPGIHAAPGARVGSIGTIATLSDWSGFQEKLGLERRTYTAGSALKNLGSGPITKEHDEYMQELVGAYSAEFKSWMSDRRGLKEADMQGQAWEARLAPAGMVDSAVFNTFEEFLAAGMALTSGA